VLTKRQKGVIMSIQREVNSMMDWMIAHNMGLIIMMAPLVVLDWVWVTITEKISKRGK